MADLTSGVKALLISIGIYMLVGLLAYSNTSQAFSFPTPPAPPSGGASILDWGGYILSLIAYPFVLLFNLLGFVASVMTMSVIPSPWRMLIAVPVGLLFFYGLFVVILEVIRRVGSLIP